MRTKKIDKNYWDDLYKSNQIGWDIGYPSPPLANYIDQLSSTELRVLIPGCGNSYEAEYLLEKGFQSITLVDIVPRLTRALEKKFKNDLGNRINVVTGDFFELQDKYDLILEQTFLSALDPILRERYVHKMHDLLNPGGKIVGVLFNEKIEEEGPPFGGSKAQFTHLFKSHFEIKTLEDCNNSIDRRVGFEYFIVLQKYSKAPMVW